MTTPAPPPHPPRPGPGRGSRPLRLVADLLDALELAEVTYCHWKSNEAIDLSLTGDNDLDLLVAPSDEARFDEVVARLGFHVARPSVDRDVPGLVDHYGLDEPSGRIVHVQAHYRLILGVDTTKNFTLPFHDAYLGSRRFHPSARHPVQVPSPELELLVFVLRMTVKHCPWDAQLALKGRLSVTERRELADLTVRADPTAVEALRARHLPYVPADLFERCRAAIEPRSGHLARATAGARLLRALEPVARRSTLTDLRLRIWRRLRWRHQSGRQASRRRLDRGGLLVGVIGGDGSGKSSAVAALEITFSRHFPTYVHHLGKPPRSLTTRALSHLMRRLPPIEGRSRTSLPAWTDFGHIGFPGHLYLLWHTLIARDRRREHRRAVAQAAAGALVICDRFPVADIELMDSPRTSRLPGLRERPLARLLAAREATYYERITPPDLLVVLRVDPDVAVARRADQDADFVRRRADEVWTTDWSRTSAVVIDASQSAEVVQADIGRAIWGAL